MTCYNLGQYTVYMPFTSAYYNIIIISQLVDTSVADFRFVKLGKIFDHRMSTHDVYL